MRDLAKERADRFAAWQERSAQSGSRREINPVDRLTRASERMSARAADLQKLAAAAKPLYDSLDDSQKRRFAMLFMARWATAIGAIGAETAERAPTTPRSAAGGPLAS